jgi:hypothetical protein
MKKIRRAILAVCLGTLGSMVAFAQTGNTAYGTDALADNTTGSYNAAFGYLTLEFNTTGGWNAATGTQALWSNSSGDGNTATGTDALYSNTTGGWNTAIGDEALLHTTTGNYNIGIGLTGGDQITTGSYNIEFGTEGTSTDSGVIRIGGGNQTSFYAAGVYSDGISSGIPVFINSDGQLGTVNSSIRFKEDIHDMAAASDGLMRLRPVTYRYKQAYTDGSKPIDYGLIAEEVAQVYPDLVVKDKDGQIRTVQYQKLTPILLNEVQKQHRTLEKQQAKIQQLEKQLAALPLLEQRLAALETAQSSSGKLEARLAIK